MTPQLVMLWACAALVVVVALCLILIIISGVRDTLDKNRLERLSRWNADGTPASKSSIHNSIYQSKEDK